MDDLFILLCNINNFSSLLELLQIWFKQSNKIIIIS